MSRKKPCGMTHQGLAAQTLLALYSFFAEPLTPYEERCPQMILPCYPEVHKKRQLHTDHRGVLYQLRETLKRPKQSGMAKAKNKIRGYQKCSMFLQRPSTS